MEILFENDNYFVLNKPSGLVVHSDGKTDEPSLADWIMENYPQMENVGEPPTLSNGTEIKKPGIVHRLDRDTSGVIVLAKNQEAFEHLKNQFKERRVQKTYRAFVYGNIKEDEGVIERPIGRSAKDFRLWSAQRGARGKMRDAITEYKVLNRGAEVTEIELYPKTGRTHQIRVHLKAINYPVVCDKLYAPKRDCILGLKRLALHSKKIVFKGLNGEKVEVRATCPPDLKEARLELQNVAK